MTVRWSDDSRGTRDPDQWVNALITIPLEFSYTAGGRTHICMVALRYTQGEGLTGGSVQPMLNPTLISS